MGGIHKTIRKATPKEVMSPAGKKLDAAVGDTWDSLNPKMPAADDEPVMPMADEEEIKRNKRRNASARGGGRASTIFTDSDRLGP
jgi:hypothetical protein